MSAPMKPIRRQRRIGGGWRWFLVSYLCLCTLALGAEGFQGSIVVAPKVWLAPSSVTPFSARIETTGAIPPETVFVVRGMPATMTLSEGQRFGRDVWVASLDAVPRLKVRAPAELGHADLTLALVALDGTSLTETKVTVYVVPASGPGDQSAAGTAGQRQLAEAERNAAMKLLEKGDDSVKAGNVQIAREFYKRAANQGLAEAALALGATYDAEELGRMQNVIGVQPDSAMAKKWYEKASELGSRDAASRLRRLQ